jgi:DNA-binding transcriptional LysR family regulator
MELRHLRYFVAVAEELNFSRAAVKLGMSQPPLSQQLKQLERELGVQLFRRVPRGVQLTRHGEVLWTAARRLTHDVERFQALAEQLQEGKEGVLRLGVVGTALLGSLPILMRHARAEMPRVAFQLEEIESGDQGAAFLEHRIDVGVLRPPVASEKLSYLDISREPLVAAIPSNHPLATAAFLDAADLRNDPFILFPRRLGTGLYDSVVEVCLQAGFLPNIVHETERMQTVVGLVATGEGVSIVPQCVTRLHLPGVEYRNLHDCTVTSLLSVAWRADNKSPVLDRFLAVVQEYVRSGYSPDD